MIILQNRFNRLITILIRLFAGIWRTMFHLTLYEEIVHCSEDNHRAAQPQRYSVQLTLHQFLVLTHFYPDITEHSAPDGRANKCEDRKQSVVYPDNAGRDA